MVATSPSSFSERLQELFAQQSTLGAFQGVRERAFQQLLQQGLPDRKQEDYNYLPLRELYETPFVLAKGQSFSKEEITSFVLPECKDSCLVFVNGVLDKELSFLSKIPATMVILSLQEAMRSYGSFLQARYARMLNDESDAFLRVNLGLATDGAFLFVPPDLSIEVPIQCLHLVQGENTEMSLVVPRLHLSLGRGAKVDIVQTMQKLGPHPVCVQGAIDAALEEGAKLNFISALSQNDLWYFDALYATLKRHSKIEAISLTSGTRCERHLVRIALLGEEASADLQGLSLLEGSAEVHHHIRVDHIAPNTHSLQRFKSVLKERSRASFQGKIYVAKEAQKTQAYQRNNTLLLGDNAITYSKPNLEIYADDVKASHGATVSELDPSQLFYLTSRGLGQEDAKDLLVFGFCEELLSKIPYRSLHEEGT